MNKFENLIRCFPFFTSRTNLIINAFSLSKGYEYVWGMKSSGKEIRNKKNKYKNSRFYYLEDGFIHSFFEEKKKIPLSICVDSSGIYYDHKSKSDLFKLIKEKLTEKEKIRSRKIIQLWKKYGVSKYNYKNFLTPPQKPFVLLVDQTFGDLSISYGGANIDSFQRMFEFAQQKWPNLTIVIKLHPDVVSHKKKGCIDKSIYSKKNVKVISEHGQINNLLESCTALCVVTSQVGFEGLIYDKEVHVFGKPFYSGLGLTIDHFYCSDRKKNHVSIEQLVLSSLVKYQKYLDPRNKKICEVEKIFEFLREKRKINNFFPNNLNCLYLTPWKARQINKFTRELNGIKLSSFRKFRYDMKNVLVWGKSNNSDKLLSNNINVIRVEDGFIRSVGLGGDLFPPMSLLFDKQGIHYDYKNKSDLEELLQSRMVTDEELKRSKKLINLIKLKKISKYNLKSEGTFLYKNNFRNKKIILVLGQVETDSSMIYGVPSKKIKKTNYSLVSQVKKDYPNLFIIYKPHPDVEKGLRSGGLEDHLISKVADLIAHRIAIQELFEICDRVAVFTSLGGFEALIRDIPVTCYGLPFYSGWGLTDDKFLNVELAKRRTKKLSLQELVYISLIEYPFYFSLKFNCITEIEDIIKEMHLCKNNNRNLIQFIFSYWGALKDFLKKKEVFK